MGRVTTMHSLGSVSSNVKRDDLQSFFQLCESNNGAPFSEKSNTNIQRNMTFKKLIHFSDDKWNHKTTGQINEVVCRILLKKKKVTCIAFF